MKHLLVLLILLAAIGETSAQTPRKWTRLKGPNVGNIGKQLLWGANGEIIAVTSLGYYVSIDDGNNWNAHSILITSPYVNFTTSGMLVAADGTYYFYVGTQSAIQDSFLLGIYRSTDKGNSWNHVMKNISVTQIIEGTNHTLLCNAYFPNQDRVFESVDQGNSWVQISKLTNVGFLSTSTDQYLFLLDYSFGRPIRYSFNDQSIAKFDSGLPSYTSFGFAFIRNGLLVIYSDSVIYTSDGESAWVPVGYIKGIHSMQLGIDKSTIFADIITYPYREYIASSTDQGKTWDSIAKIANGTLIANYSNPDKLIDESSEAIFLSTDRNNSIKEIGLPAASIYTLLVDDENRIFAKKYNDSTQISLDNGSTWSNINPRQNYSVDQIIHGPNGNIFTLAYPYNTNVASIFIFDTTTNQWSKKSSLPYDLLFNSIITSDRLKYIFLSGGTSIYRSDDNGFSWLDINAPNTGEYINSIEAIADGTLYFGALPVMYRSDDHGTTWTKLLPVHDIVRLTQIKAFGATGVLLGTEGDGLLISSDKGNSWTRLDGNRFDTVTCLAIDSKGGIAVGTIHGLWTYDPATQTWTKVTLGRDSDLNIGGLDVAKNDDIYVGTYGSSIWVGTTHYDSSKTLTDESALIKISPNPASERVTVDLDLPSSSNVKLVLYDVLGRRIEVVAEGVFSGDNRFSLNTSNLAGGCYTLVLSGSKSGAQKFVVR